MSEYNNYDDNSNKPAQSGLTPWIPLILAIIYAITVNNQNFDMFISLLSGLSSLFLYMEIMQYNFSTMCSIHKLRKKYFLYSGFFCILCVVNVLTLIIN